MIVEAVAVADRLEEDCAVIEEGEIARFLAATLIHEGVASADGLTRLSWALARAVLEDFAAHPTGVHRFADLLDDAALSRVIAGLVVPSDDVKREIARRLGWDVSLEVLFDGAMLSTRSKVSVLMEEMALAEDPQGTVAGIEQHFIKPVGDDGNPAGEILATMRGRLGECLPGPLFTPVTDPFAPGTFVVTGLGIALVLTEAQALALLGAVHDGLSMVSAARHAGMEARG